MASVGFKKRALIRAGGVENEMIEAKVDISSRDFDVRFGII